MKNLNLTWVICWIGAAMAGVVAILSIARPESDLLDRFQRGLPLSIAGQGRIFFDLLNLIVIAGVASFVTYAFRRSKTAFLISLAAPLALSVRDLVIGKMPVTGIMLGLLLLGTWFDQAEPE